VSVASLARDVFGNTFQNPLLLAAGTAGFGREVEGVIDLDALGGVTTKAVSPEPRHGNPAPRVAETEGAMLNSVGLANPGLEAVRREHLPWLREHHPDLRVVVNVVGHTVEDFITVVGGLASEPGITAFELNVSCPNVEQGGVEFGADVATLGTLVRRARDSTDRALVVKLSAGLADAVQIAEAAMRAGASGFTCVNTLPAAQYQGAVRPGSLGKGPGGVSGPPLLPIGVRITRAVASATGAPVIGAGGIRSARDARQYLEAGASLIAIGTAALADPRVPERIARDLAHLKMEAAGAAS
jgi:dihydroorotate dehydrogenase (NAD+) catalytic subunit